MVRRVLSARWMTLEHPAHLRFEIRATAFCHQMVRSIVGTMIQVGAGGLHAGDVMSIMRARNRGRAATLAPPHGLMLWEVGY